ANINKLMEQIDNLPHKDIIRQPLIIAMDNDQAGEKAAAQLESEFIKAGICFYRADSNKLYLGCKDANAALIQDKEALKEQITAAELAALEVWAKRQYDYINENSAQAAMQDFINGIRTKAATKAISTGFKELDLQLSGDSSDGGLFEGLYIIGAISSLGKTTLVLQIADQIAAAGNDVLIFSLEMARDELIAKSISRHTIQEVLSGGGDIRNAKTTRGITSLARWKKYNQKEIETINNAMAAYNSYANHIFIFEGIGDYSADTIRSKVEKHIAITGNTPVIIVDYIQILAPQSDKLTDKQAIDKSVLELKRISRDFKAAVIGISSFNRNNYSEAVNMAAFKESGAIEYSSDVLIGLQLVGAGEKNFDADKAKKENPRKIELRILKNRNGQTGGRVYFEYYALFNFFRPSVKDFDSETNEPPTKGAKVV
ncbi:DNA primase, partial [bacterium]|nr:DNA primase [bacterium]